MSTLRVEDLRARAGSPRPARRVPWRALATAAAMAGSALAGGLAHDWAFHREAEGVANPAVAVAAPPVPLLAGSVTLPPGKLEAAGLALAEARVEALPRSVGVTGRVGANLDRRVEVRPRAPGVIRSVHATLGQQVEAGQLLAVVDSAEVGKARLDLHARLRDLATARTEERWRRTVADNDAELIDALRKGMTAKDVQSGFADRPLGEDRARLMTAYAELEIKLHEEDVQTELYKREIIGEHPVFLAVHAREAAQAKFDAELEQIRYDAAQKLRVAEQRARDAEAAVIDAAHRLRILGVDQDIAALLDAPAPPAAPEEDVTAYRLVAPIAGRVIARSAVPSQPADPTVALVTVADLSSVWVSADVPESDLGALAGVEPGSTVRLTATAYPGRSFEATVLSLGAGVDPATRTVPLLAEAANSDGLLKLGMFARVALAGGLDEPAPVVPASAVVRLEGEPIVFVPDPDDPATFRPRPVEPGPEVDGRLAIRSGLAGGDRVVATGAFLLKSELILQNEEDED